MGTFSYQIKKNSIWDSIMPAPQSIFEYYDIIKNAIIVIGIITTAVYFTMRRLKSDKFHDNIDDKSHSLFDEQNRQLIEERSLTAKQRETIERLSHERNEAVTNIGKLEGHIQVLEGEIQHLRAQVQELENYNISLQTEVSRMTTAFDSLNQIIIKKLGG